ncbi:MAG TPA: (Fe-S)-binding protein [Mycobacteriales bacterium]|nr:(Fe-S)-binding protein [Mycobacteriales bacterium]
MTVAALAIAGRRVLWLSKLIRVGQPAPGRMDGVPARLKAELAEVLGQRKLLKWSVPGVAHFLTFWGFIVLGLTIVEAWGGLFDRDFHIPLIGRWRLVGFLEDFFAVAVLAGIITFAILRVRNAPARKERASRFYGSHTRAAWVILGMISLVIITLLLYRGAQVNTGVFPFGQSRWAFASWAVGKALHPLGEDANEVIETVFLLANVAVILAFLVIVVYSKHLHIALAPLNVGAKRVPDGLGPLLPVTDAAGKPIDFEDAENLDEDQAFGRGKVEDFTWKGMLDFATCTECGRCQSQCPAWNTGKPLSPKLVIMDLRDHLFAKAPYLLATNADGAGTNGGTGTGAATAGKSAGGAAATGIDEGGPEAAEHGAAHGGVPESGFWRVPEPGAAQAERPLVGTLEEGGVIDPDVLWSCTTCGACVEQCPVDIEHVDHIVDMRRYQVLVESSFPSEAGVMLRNIENKGNPWGLSDRAREEWTDGLDFEVRRVEAGEPIPDEVEYLFWVGCAGALEDRSKKVTRAFAELLNVAGVEFAILGAGETCTGDPARRLGNEFLFQMQAMQNVETLNSIGAKKIVATCPHCFNTLANEYPQNGGNYEVVHHTQLLGKLVAEGRLTPVKPLDQLVTYHDPCYLGRHNKVYTPPREVLSSVPGLRQQEMHRCKERGFCCGAGGARMWMEEKIGKRINVERVDEALSLDPDVVSTACPYCMVMLSDAVTAKQQEGTAREDVEVLDVAQILRRSLAAPAAAAAPAAE